MLGLAGAETPIVLISASGGYGKSMLAAQWGTRCERPVARLNLDRADNDPVAFLDSAVAHALDRLDPVAPELLDELDRRHAPGRPGRSPRLGSGARPVRRPVELIFDDVQELTQPQCLAALDYLLDEVPSGLAGRSRHTRPPESCPSPAGAWRGSYSRSAPTSSPSMPTRRSRGPLAQRLRHLSEQAQDVAPRTNGGDGRPGSPSP